MHAHCQPHSVEDDDRSRCAHRSACLVALLVLSVCSPAAAVGAHAGVPALERTDAVVTYRPPVDAPVTDPFRPPLTPYGPGNRGIDYATAPGMSVHAAADGVVVFAGAVAGGLHVTVLHADGIRTTYSFLAVIRVHERQTLRGGDVLGVTGVALHLGARRGDVYIDPASLWRPATGPPAVHLVPLDGSGPRQDETASAGPTLRESKGAITGTLAWAAPHGASAAAAEVGHAFG